MTIIHTMSMVGLFGLAMHFELYWAAGGLVVLFLILLGLERRRARRRRRLP